MQDEGLNDAEEEKNNEVIEQNVCDFNQSYTLYSTKMGINSAGGKDGSVFTKKLVNYVK